MAKKLKDLTVQELLACAIQSEEEDGRIYADLAQRMRKDYPATAQSLQAMHDEEDGHRHRLINLYRERFGEHIPLVRRQDVQGFITRKPLWLAANLPVAMIRREVEMMENEAHNFYQAAIAQTSDAGGPTDFGPILGLPPYSPRGQMITRSACHWAATLTISRSGRP